MRNDIGKRWESSLGARPSESGARFRVWAPAAESVILEVGPGTREIPLAREERGYFGVFVPGIRAGERYFYILDGSRKCPDPASRFQPDGVHGASEVMNPDEFPWEDGDWRGVPLEELVLYELHAGTFSPPGTFEGVIPSLDYLRRDLGVTAIELMPVAQFPGDRNWGYDGVFLFAPQNTYGGPRGLKTLVNACHRQGLAVILDVVYNHLGPEGNYLGAFGPYFTERYRTPWGPAINFDGPGSDEVRLFVIESALSWLTEFHIDGLRLDAVHGIFDFGARHILADIRDAVRSRAEAESRTILVMAESDLNDVRILDSPRRGGYGLDAQWNDDFHHCVHTLLTGERQGYYGDFGDIRQLAGAVRRGFVFTGQYSGFRRRRHGSSSRHLPPSKFVIFSQNHDQIGNRTGGERLASLVPFEALKLAAGMILLMPNIPLLFMGEEYGEDAPFHYFASFADPVIVEAVRRGRADDLKLVSGTGSSPDPFGERAFLRSKIDLARRSAGDHKLLLDLYRTLIELRRTSPAFRVQAKKNPGVRTFPGKRILLVSRESASGRAVCLFNFEPRPVTVDLPHTGGPLRKVLDSSDERWGGKGGTAPAGIEGGRGPSRLSLSPFGFCLYAGSDSPASLGRE